MEKLFNKKEVAEYLMISVRTVDRLTNNLEIPVFKVGRQIRIPESAVIMMLKRNKMPANERVKIINDFYKR